MNSKVIRVLGAGIAAAALVANSGPALAGGDREVRRRGGCSRASTWKIKIDLEDGRLNPEFEVDQNVVGDRWRVVMRDNGIRFFRGIRTTRPPSGSFEVERLTRNRRGPDTVVARARNLRTGELCRGRATF
jgi:hypothetical protein